MVHFRLVTSSGWSSRRQRLQATFCLVLLTVVVLMFTVHCDSGSRDDSNQHPIGSGSGTAEAGIGGADGGGGNGDDLSVCRFEIRLTNPSVQDALVFSLEPPKVPAHLLCLLKENADVRQSVVRHLRWGWRSEGGGEIAFVDFDTKQFTDEVKGTDSVDFVGVAPGRVRILLNFEERPLGDFGLQIVN